LIKAAGGVTIAQSEQSCVVFGMPKAAIERGHAMRIVDLQEMASTLRTMCSERVMPDRAMRAAND